MRTIDVIINNHNYARFLAAAIDSALAQTHPAVRVLVVDDGSTDGSRALIAAYGDRVVPVLKDNGGQASAFNAGFEQSTADVVIFLDADDALEPDIAARVDAALDAHPSVAKLQWPTAVIDEAGRLSGQVLPAPHLPMPSGDWSRAELRFAFDIPWMATSANAFPAVVLRRILPMPETPFRLGADWYLQHLTPLLGPVRSLDAVGGRPLHVHLSEQKAENEACLGHYGVTPTELLDAGGALGASTTAVHATHLTATDIATLGRTRTSSCFCPTTERDLADGIGPALELLGAGSPLCLGSDQHAVIDLIEEARALEMHERLISHERGRKQPPELVTALTDNGHRALGWDDAGRIEVGMRADLVAVRLDTVRTVGSLPDQILLSAFAADVDTVVVDGRVIVSGGEHRSFDVAQELHSSIQQVWSHPEATR